MGTNAAVVITDLSGKLILKQSLRGHEATFDMKPYASGMYFINYTDDSHNETIKVNKQ